MKHYTPEDVQELRAKVLRITGTCNQYSPQQVADLINAAVEAERATHLYAKYSVEKCALLCEGMAGAFAQQGKKVEATTCNHLAKILRDQALMDIISPVIDETAEAIRARGDNGEASNGHKE